MMVQGNVISALTQNLSVVSQNSITIGKSMLHTKVRLITEIPDW